MAAQSANADALGIVQVGKAGGEPQRISELQGLFVQGQFNADATVVRFTNGGNAPARYVVTQAGYDLNARKALSRGIEIVRDYTDEQGKPVTQVTLGQKINVHLKVRANSKEGRATAIVDLLPGGFEVVQQTPPEPADAGEESEDRGGWQSPLAATGSTRRRITAISVKIG